MTKKDTLLEGGETSPLKFTYVKLIELNPEKPELHIIEEMSFDEAKKRFPEEE